MIAIVTKAYNSQKTIRRCIESVLRQTYSDFTYYLIDNGSHDETGKIIQEYAKLDKRIVPYSHKDNIKKGILNTCIGYTLDDQGNNSYFCMLDADDEYAPDFLEKMLIFIQENNLEVASCGTDWIDEKTGKIIKHKVIDQTILLEGQNFSEQFPRYRNFIVTVWGAVYSLDLLRKCNFEWYNKAMNFGDTGFCMETFCRAKRAGVLAESLHKYYISPTTVSYQYNPDWFQACKYLDKINREYLLRYGKISEKNKDYLCVLFLVLIKYILPRIQRANVNLSDKLKSLSDIFNDDMTKYTLKHWEKVGIYSDKSEFLHEIEEWIYAQDGWEASRQNVEEIITAMNI